MYLPVTTVSPFHTFLLCSNFILLNCELLFAYAIPTVHEVTHPPIIIILAHLTACILLQLHHSWFLMRIVTRYVHYFVLPLDIFFFLRGESRHWPETANPIATIFTAYPPVAQPDHIILCQAQSSQSSLRLFIFFLLEELLFIKVVASKNPAVVSINSNIGYKLVSF